MKKVIIIFFICMFLMIGYYFRHYIAFIVNPKHPAVILMTKIPAVGIIKVDSGEIIKVLHSDYARSLSVNEAQREFACIERAYGSASVTFVFDYQGRMRQRQEINNKPYSYHFALSPDFRKYAVYNSDYESMRRTVNIHDIAADKVALAAIENIKGNIENLAWISNNEMILMGNLKFLNADIAKYDINKKAIISKVKLEHHPEKYFVQPDGKQIILVIHKSDDNCLIQKFDSTTMRVIDSFEIQGTRASAINDICMSPSGRYIAYGDSFGIGIFDLKTRKLKKYHKSINSLNFLTEDTIVYAYDAFSEKKASVRKFDIKTEKESVIAYTTTWWEARKLWPIDGGNKIIFSD